ncbi:WxL domain-containing protein [Enterococcus sp. UD-01]|jgi:hypothetical protein|uniref:WxL domain-containing protein n=1 Tax=Enterococcus sp. UD-01 TaxID=3373911 RepID=UPI003834E46C
MKKTIKGMYGLSLAAIALVSFASPAAAVEGNKQTEGKASFVPQTGAIDTIKPGTNDKIEVDGGNTDPVIAGNVQLIRIPDFDFGNNETSVNTQSYAALNEKYKNKGGAEKYAIPHFVQVGDVSGVQGTKWNVTVEQDSLFKSGEHTLKATRINIYNQTLTNNVHTANVADVVSGLAIPSSSSVQIPVKGADTTGAITVLTSKAGKTDETTTNGTISSVVFAGNYNAANFGADGPDVNSKNEDVKLSVPQSDGVQAKNYSTKLNWTLTVEP